MTYLMFWIVVTCICTLMAFTFIRACIDSIIDDLRKINNCPNANRLCINPFKSKRILLSRTERSFDVPDIIIRGNKIDFIESASNLGVIFIDRLTRSNNFNIIMRKEVEVAVV